MSAQKIEELAKDLAELEICLSHAKRQRNIDALTLHKKRIETDITNLRSQSGNSEPVKISSTTTTTSAEPKRYLKDITSYAWDQSDKFIKIFIALDGIKADDNAKANTVYTTNGITLKVNDVENTDYIFEVKNTLSKIDIGSSYHKVKNNSIVIYAKKATQGENWSHLTLTEKRLADNKKPKPVADEEGDPSAGIMNIMKTMYESGDSETKRMIAKAWTEGQDKQRQGSTDLF